MKRRYLYVAPAGGGVSVGLVSEQAAINTLAEKPSHAQAALAMLTSAKNGEHFTAYYGEAEIIVLVDAE